MNTKNTLLLSSLVLLIALSFFIGATGVLAYSYTCSGGSCFYAVCGSDADCGGNYFTGPQTCSNNSVYQSYRTNTCMNPGTEQSYCVSSSSSQLQKVCASNQTCSYGACVGDSPKNTQSNPPVYYNPTPSPSTAPSTFIKHYRTNCYSSNVYWYNSEGSVEDVAKNCMDANSCTVDSCSDAACRNTLVCDGSTCATGSADYQTYCVTAANQTQTPNQNQTTPQVTIQIPQVQVQNISIALTGKKESDSKYAEEFSITNSDKINFLVAVKNVSSAPVENVIIKVDGDAAIAYDEAIKIDNIPSTGNMVTGINLGTLPAGISKEVFFSGSIKPETIAGSVKITSTVSYQNTTSTDSVTVSMLGAVKNNFAAALGSSAIMMWFKKWWLWILATLVLIGLFFVIYRRISSDV